MLKISKNAQNMIRGEKRLSFPPVTVSDTAQRVSHAVGPVPSIQECLQGLHTIWYVNKFQ